MALRDELQKRIDRKRSEIGELESKIQQARSYMQAMEEVLRLLPREANHTFTVTDQTLRVGSNLAKAKEALQAARKPLHIGEILKAIGKPVDRMNRAALSGSLSAYVRKGEIFTRPAPNTFGLVEFGEALARRPQSEPPDDFGVDDAEFVDVDSPPYH